MSRNRSLDDFPAATIQTALEEVAIDVEQVPKNAAERETIVGFLDANRAVMAWKLEGMDDAAARVAPFASDTSMIGMIQHLTVVEKSWFEAIFSGRDVDYGFDFDADRDAEWHLGGDETIGEAVAAYEAQIAVSNEIVASSDLDAMAEKEIRGERYSLRWIVVHMIEETARHAGHADILREHLDGSLGYLPEL